MSGSPAPADRALAARPGAGGRAPTTIEPPSRPADELVYAWCSSDPSAQYDVRDLLAAILDGGRFDEYRAEYGRTHGLRLWLAGRNPLGIVATNG